MTVSTTIATISYDGDGATTIFPTGFAFFTTSDIEVIERETATGLETFKTAVTDYTVTGREGSPGSVHAVVAPPATVSWTIRRVLTEAQETDLPVAGSLPSTAIEQMTDRTVMMVQQHSEEIGRTLVFPKTDAGTLDPTLPSSVDRAGKFLKFDSSGNPAAAATINDELPDGSAASPSLNFASDSNLGLFRVGANVMGFASAGAEAARLDAAGVGLKDGTEGLPSLHFTGDADTGYYRISEDTLGISAGGTEIARLDSNGLAAIDGAAAAPSFSFTTDLDTGLYRVGTDTLGIAAGGDRRVCALAPMGQPQSHRRIPAPL